MELHKKNIRVIFRLTHDLRTDIFKSFVFLLTKKLKTFNTIISFEKREILKHNS